MAKLSNMQSLATALCLGALWLAPTPALGQRTPVAGRRAPTAAPGGYVWFIRGELLMAAHRHVEAAAAFDMARGLAEPRDGSALAVAAHALRLGGPEDPLLLARIAEALDLAGKTADASDVLAEAIASGPGHVAVALAEARIALRHGRGQQAVAALQRAVQLSPLSPQPAHALAKLLREQGHQERAHGVLSALASRQRARGQPTGRTALSLALHGRDARQLAAAVRHAVGAASEADDRTLQAAAASLLAAGLPGAALEALQVIGAARVDPALMLEALLANGQLARVEAWLVEHPASALGGPLRAAEAYLRIGRPQRAAQLCELRLAAKPRDPAGRLLAATIDLAVGRPAEAALTASELVGSTTRGRAAARTLAGALHSGGLRALSEEIAAR